MTYIFVPVVAGTAQAEAAMSFFSTKYQSVIMWRSILQTPVCSVSKQELFSSTEQHRGRTCQLYFMLVHKKAWRL